PSEGALADPGDVFDQQVAPGDQADQGEIDDLILAVDPPSNDLTDGREGLGVGGEGRRVVLGDGDRGVHGCRGVYAILRQNMIPSRTESRTCSTRGLALTCALKRTIAWSFSD